MVKLNIKTTKVFLNTGPPGGWRLQGDPLWVFWNAGWCSGAKNCSSSSGHLRLPQQISQVA